MQQKSELPEGWVWTNYGSVLSKIANGTTLKQNKEGKGVPVTRIETISNGTIDTNKFGYIENIDEASLEKYILIDGDILFSHINSDIHLGKTAIYESSPKLLLHGMNLLLLRTYKEIIFPNYLYYLSFFYRSTGEFISVAQHAVNQSSINQKILRNIQIPLPPLAEQHRIVSAIEALFAHLDVTNEKLDRVLEVLKTFRQAVIKLALQGKLVGQNPIDEPALKLIETIRTDQTKDKIEKKKLISDSAENLFELPYSWKWIRLEELLIFGPKNGYSPKPVNYVTNVRALTLTATTSGKFRDDCFKYIDEKIDPKSHLWLEENDILIQRGNTIEYVGIAAIYTGPCNAFIYPDLMMKIRVHPKINVGFLHMVINSKFSHKYFEKKATGTSGSMPKINQSTVVNLPIPLPPLAEQQEIVRRVDTLFAFADSIEAKVSAAREKTEKLRQSILARAFSGQLVETEAEIARKEGRDYESAEALLKRIKTEKGKN